ncbi:MAG: transglutaminase-like cysteine peptidase [Pseudomonadota bacterium]
MRLGFIIAVCVLLFLPAAACVAHAGANERFLTVYGPAKAPFGFRAFCERHPVSCRRAAPRQPLHLTARLWDDLDGINLEVNRSIRPMSDLDLHGVAERWSYPTSVGDCEDFVLLKRQRLIARGWPASALHITVVKDENGVGHAVLTVRTTSGDLVLDNRTDAVVRWHALPYDFLKRQSAFDPLAWVALTPMDSALPERIVTSSGAAPAHD